MCSSVFNRSGTGREAGRLRSALRRDTPTQHTHPAPTRRRESSRVDFASRRRDRPCIAQVNLRRAGHVNYTAENELPARRPAREKAARYDNR